MEEAASVQITASEQHLVLDDVQVERAHDAHGPLLQLSAPPRHAASGGAASLQRMRPEAGTAELWSWVHCCRANHQCARLLA